VQRFVDDIVALPDAEIFDAMLWVMERCKLVVEGAAAAPVAALLHGSSECHRARGSSQFFQAVTSM
jgi:threonine dehydratase